MQRRGVSAHVSVHHPPKPYAAAAFNFSLNRKSGVIVIVAAYLAEMLP